MSRSILLTTTTTTARSVHGSAVFFLARRICRAQLPVRPEHVFPVHAAVVPTCAAWQLASCRSSTMTVTQTMHCCKYWNRVRGDVCKNEHAQKQTTTKQAQTCAKRNIRACAQTVSFEAHRQLLCFVFLVLCFLMPLLEPDGGLSAFCSEVRIVALMSHRSPRADTVAYSSEIQK